MRRSRGSRGRETEVGGVRGSETRRLYEIIGIFGRKEEAVLRHDGRRRAAELGPDSRILLDKKFGWRERMTARGRARSTMQTPWHLGQPAAPCQEAPLALAVLSPTRGVCARPDGSCPPHRPAATRGRGH